MILKIKKRVAINIYQCNVFDNGSKSLVQQIVRVKEGYPIEKLFLDKEKEILCEAVLLETEMHNITLGIDLDDITVSVLKDEII